MQTIFKLAKSYHAYQKSDISTFQRKARILQSMWRVENMERPARDCKDRHKPILLMRHGGA